MVIYCPGCDSDRTYCLGRSGSGMEYECESCGRRFTK